VVYSSYFITEKTDCCDITEILLKMALNTITQKLHFLSLFCCSLLGITASGNSFGIFKRLTIVLSVLLGITASGNSFAVIQRRTDNTMVKRLKIPKELPEAVIPRRTDNTMVKRLKIPKELPEAVIPRRTGQQKKYKKCNFGLWCLMPFSTISQLYHNSQFFWLETTNV
jgi:hypothetical protein